MTKKSTQSFWHWVSDMRIITWLYISPRSFTDRYSSCGWASRSTSSWFCFSLWSACKASTFVFNANSSNFISEVSCSLSLSSLFVRNSDPRVKSVTNLTGQIFKSVPWEILTHEWEILQLSFFFFFFKRGSILISTPSIFTLSCLHLYWNIPIVEGQRLGIQPEVYTHIHIHIHIHIHGQMIFHLLAKCNAHDIRDELTGSDL